MRLLQSTRKAKLCPQLERTGATLSSETNVIARAVTGLETTTASAPTASARIRRPSPSLRILLVVESAGGGTGRHVLDLAEGLAQRDCDVHVAYSTRRADRMFLDRRNAMSGVTFIEVPCRTAIHPSDYAAMRALRRYIRRLGPFQIIHGHSSKGGALARLAALGSASAAFYTLHGLIMMDPGLARWKRMLYLGI